MKIGIIGFGVVGKAVCYTLEKYYLIIKYDKYTKLNTFSDLKYCDFVFITVPTPFDCLNNKVDISAIDESLTKLEEIGYNKIVIIKSTVPPGTCNYFLKHYDLQISFNPEFLRESITPNKDFKNQDTVVIGSTSEKDYNLIKKMYKKVLLNSAKYYFTSTLEAEMVKSAQNTMLASRVALANMIFDSCNEHNIDYNLIKEIAFDNFEIIGPHLTQVPGPDGFRGFGGKCLPKDIRAFSSVNNSELLESIIIYNDSLRTDLSEVLKNFKPMKK